MTQQELHDRIVRRSEKIIRKLEALIADLEYWNKLNPKAEPLDVEPERVMLAMEYKNLRLFLGGDLQAALDSRVESLEYYGRIMKEVSEGASQ